ncbi:MAG: putative General secretion pathway protein GspG [Parcubacteria group bacterium Gr01-1014_33]|nr:MAG: putative General secretion pathway protein GspG [Parcubacteria group bacterium Gr01-1014_33]
MTHDDKKTVRFSYGAGFTLIELLVVIAIISVLASVVLASVNSARAKARDARRLSDMKQIQLALQLFYDTNNRYPSVAESGDDPGLAGWRVSFLPNFLAALTPTYMPIIPGDPINSGPPVSDGNPFGSMFNSRPDGTFFYMYYNYGAGSSYGYSWSGPFSVFGFRSVEATDKTKLPKAQCGPMPCTGGSYPGINTPTCRDWSSEFDYSIFLVP